MWNRKKKFIPASRISEEFTRGEYEPDSLLENSFYRQMAENLKSFNVDLISDNPLETLYNHICHLDNLFRLLRNPWHVEAGEIQKACAYYVAHAKLSKQENDAFTDMVNGFVASVCYLTEWHDFICQMQQFFCHQEKELRQVFKVQKQKAVGNDKPAIEAATYCMTVGESEIYGMTYEQLEELYKAVGLFIKREKAPFDCNIKGYNRDPISIDKSVNFDVRKEVFFVDYSLDTFESSLNCMSADQLKRVADIISEFLKTYGENGDRKVYWDIADYSSVVSGREIYFRVNEDSRSTRFMTPPYVRKRIDKMEDRGVEIRYDINVNELESVSLSFEEFISLYRQLGSFLN